MKSNKESLESSSNNFQRTINSKKSHHDLRQNTYMWNCHNKLKDKHAKEAINKTIKKGYYKRQIQFIAVLFGHNLLINKIVTDWGVGFLFYILSIIKCSTELLMWTKPQLND